MTTTGDQLALQAIAQAADDPVTGSMSPLGSALLGITKLAVVRASDGIDASEFAAAGAEVASQLMPLIQPAISDIVNELSAVASATDMAGVIPVIGQALQFAGAIADAAAAQSAAEQAHNVQKCHDMFVDVLPGTGVAGQRVPADIFGAPGSQVIAKTPSGRTWLKAGTEWVDLPYSTVGSIFALASEDLVDSPYDQKDSGDFLYYPSYSTAGWIKRTVNLQKALEVATGQHSKLWGQPLGIEQGTRTKLRMLRSAMSLSRGSSFDGGKSIFPIYIDLFIGQLRQNRISKAWVHHVWATVLSGTFGDVDCTHVERRGIAQWDSMIRAWELTANPLYGFDKLALQNLLAKLQKPKVNRLHGLQGANVNSLVLQGQGLRHLSPLPHIAPSSASPVRPVRFFSTRVAPTAGRTMSPGEHQRIIDAIIAAAHGDGHPPAGRELHVDDDLDPNDPMTAMPEYPGYQDVEYDDDDYATVDRYFANLQGDIGGDDFSFYGPNCFEENDALEDEDDEELDPWGDQFIGVGASRASQVKHLQPIAKKLLPAPKPTYVQPMRNVASVMPRPAPVVQPMTNVAPVMPRPAPVVHPLRNIPRPVQPTVHPMLQPLTKAPLKHDRPSIQSLRTLRPMPRPASPPSPVSDAYGAGPVDEMADDQLSDEELAQGYDEYDQGSEDEQYAGDSTDWGYGYGDFGDEECYPHDGSTYGWDDY